MADLPKGFDAGALYCFPLGLPQEGRFACLPGLPALELAQGVAKASLLTSVGTTAVALEAVWQVDAAALEEARRTVAARYPERAEISLAPAELMDVTATLTVAGAAPAPRSFGPKPASNTASNRVVFNQALDAAEKLAAVRAFRGEAGLLTLRYAGTLALSERSAVEVTGDLAATVKGLAPAPAPVKSGGSLWGKKDPPPPPPVLPTPAACAQAVDAAIARGELALTRKDTPNAPPQRGEQLAAQLRAQLAAMVLDKLRQFGADVSALSSLPIRLESAAPASVRFNVDRSLDLGAWFAGHGGDRLVRDIPTP